MLKDLKLDRRHLFFGILIIFSLYFIYKLVFPLYLNKPIRVTIIKNKENIVDLNTPVNVDFENFIDINTINFPENRMLFHKNFGSFGFSSNFFLNFKTKMFVKKEGLYTFFVSSDDGFRMKIDDNVVGEYIYDRPFSTTEISVYLKKGLYNVEISYFQGYGPCGIVVHYKYFESKSKHLFGKNSSYISFIYPGKQ